MLLGISWGPPRNLLRQIEKVLFIWTPKPTTTQLYKPTISFSVVTDAPQTKSKRRSTSTKDIPNQIAVISIRIIAIKIVFRCRNCGHQDGADQVAAINLITRASDREVTLYTPYQGAKNLLDLRFQRRLESGTGDASVSIETANDGVHARVTEGDTTACGGTPNEPRQTWLAGNNTNGVDPQSPVLRVGTGEDSPPEERKEEDT